MDLFVKCAEVTSKVVIVVCTLGLFWCALVVTP